MEELTTALDSSGTDSAYRVWEDGLIRRLENFRAIGSAAEGRAGWLFRVESAADLELRKLQSSYFNLVEESLPDVMKALLEAGGVDATVESAGRNPWKCVVWTERSARVGALFLLPQTGEDVAVARARAALSACRLDRLEAVWAVDRQAASELPKRLLGVRDVAEGSVLDFVRRHFGAMEEERFAERALSLSARARRAIGYATVKVPIEDELAELRQRFRDVLSSEFLPRIERSLADMGLAHEQIAVVRRNLVERGRMEALLGKEDFAQSLLASEWRYLRDRSDEGIEQTGTMVGYAKSVEQLLWAVARAKADEGFEMTLYKGDDPHEVTADFLEEKKESLTLGTLTHFIGDKRNARLFERSLPVRNHVSSLLSSFADEVRNGSFHKVNVWSREEVADARDRAVTISLLLLGGLSLDESQESALLSKADDPGEGVVQEKARGCLESLFRRCGVVPGAKLTLMAAPVDCSGAPRSNWMLRLSIDFPHETSDCDEFCTLKWPGERAERSMSGLLKRTVSELALDPEFAPAVTSLSEIVGYALGSDGVLHEWTATPEGLAP